MKISRHKKVHRYLSFYSNNYGFRQPYQVLIDGTFCYAALKNKFNIKEHMPKYLDAEVKLLTTPCVIIETESLGHTVFGAMIIVKQFAIHRCGHTGKPVPGSVCLKSMLGSENSSRYIIATQDRELQRAAREIPGTPLIYLHQKAPTLEHPSAASERIAQIQNQAKFHVSKEAGNLLTSLKKQKLGISTTDTQEQRKKKKNKGPNPLSCKKKKKKSSVETVKQGVIKKSRKRKRVKVAEHVKEHLINKAKEHCNTN
ncbi:hypothetical protein L9F63_005977 [Diploptera punctata]|uniref:rRNA-processing protein UTP23 homolog n=1 Tax=Diploptera punctata TaxID=6984 RepID=A0AAD7ZBJ1_DIPPU|nr:hypothetical protein L9F63_005977 [Diploptera punctata]